ncbi:MAG: hypothetical protein ACYSOX_02850 [Planctomycetota bacterium]
MPLCQMLFQWLCYRHPTSADQVPLDKLLLQPVRCRIDPDLYLRRIVFALSAGHQLSHPQINRQGGFLIRPGRKRAWNALMIAEKEKPRFGLSDLSGLFIGAFDLAYCHKTSHVFVG